MHGEQPVERASGARVIVFLMHVGWLVGVHDGIVPVRIVGAFLLLTRIVRLGLRV